MSDVKRRVCKSRRVHRLQTRRLRWHLAIDRCRSLQPRSVVDAFWQWSSNDLLRSTSGILHPYPHSHRILLAGIPWSARDSSVLVCYYSFHFPAVSNLKCLPTSIVYTTRSFLTIPSILHSPLSIPAFSLATSYGRTIVICYRIIALCMRHYSFFC